MTAHSAFRDRMRHEAADWLRIADNDPAHVGTAALLMLLLSPFLLATGLVWCIGWVIGRGLTPILKALCAVQEGSDHD